MPESYHNPPAAQVKTWSPGRPIKLIARKTPAPMQQHTPMIRMRSEVTV